MPKLPHTFIFHKATFSGVFTNYDSFIPDTYKIGLVHTLLFRFFKICSSMENFHIEVELQRSIFKCNNYTVNIIDQCIKKFFDKLYDPKHIVPTVPKEELLVVLAYLGTFSLNLRKRLYKSVSKSFPQCNIKVIFQSKNRLSGFFKFKDSIFAPTLFINFSVVIAILLTMAKLNVILKLGLVSI